MQVPLQRPDVLLPHAQVVQQVARALAIARLDLGDLAGVLGLELKRAFAQVTGCGQRAFDEAVHDNATGRCDRWGKPVQFTLGT